MASPPSAFHGMWEALLATTGVLLVVAATASPLSLYASSTASPTAVSTARLIPVAAPTVPRANTLLRPPAAAALSTGAEQSSGTLHWDAALGAAAGFLSVVALAAWRRRDAPLTALPETIQLLHQPLSSRASISPAPASSVYCQDPIISMMGVTGIQDIAAAPDVIGPAAEPGSRHRRIEALMRRGQEKICRAVEACDGKGRFRTDAWSLPNGNGGGISMVMADGGVWEKAGCNLSVIRGTMPQSALQAATERHAEYLQKLGLQANEPVPFFVSSVSCVMHPRNPFCPTMHFNYRYFELNEDNWWFAGGTDITPAYIDEEDMKHFHGTYKEICDRHDPSYYTKFKQWADRYFLIPHRGETRGLGGIFFDDLNDRDPEDLFRFQEECLMAVADAYVPIVAKHKNDSFTEEQKQWQLLRRGRYTEFNLVYDRGTIFGLRAGGRIESILMSIPETARWEYCHKPAPGSAEERLLDACRTPREWV